MVVAVGLTVTPTPLEAAMLPGVMMPVPLAKTPVNVALCPELMVPGCTLKLVIAGAA